jgi:ubiquinone/menaquinone biosynthesis C-methylase UbiE
MAALAVNTGDDSVIQALKEQPASYHDILEIGCSNGWRLEALRREYHASCHGIDPSLEAVKEGQKSFPELSLRQGTADELDFGDDAFDLVIFGFCLYLCDRSDLFQIAREADRVLRDRGRLVIFDFFPPFSYRNPYAHQPDLWTYKMNYAAMFLWHPAYALLSHKTFSHGSTAGVDEPDERIAVSILIKNEAVAHPVNPFTVPRG